MLITNMTLRSLIRTAYHIQDNQVAGGPAWAGADRFDIEAKSDGPAQDPQLLAMLQTLLAERFQLAFHREPRIFPGYALVVSRKRLKIRPDEGKGGSTANSNRSSIVVERATMAKFADILSRKLRYPVVDETNTPGAFSFKLEWTPDPPADAATADPARPDLFTVIEQQLGLKLEIRKVPAEVLVIDRAEKPAEN